MLVKKGDRVLLPEVARGVMLTDDKRSLVAVLHEGELLLVFPQPAKVIEGE
jgi:hypothetical protein